MTALTIVTGASAGLGEGFATTLAAKGHSLLLVARRQDRLDALASMLRTKHNATVETLVADLAAPDGAAKLLEHVGGRSVGTLVNNAGVGARGAFSDLDLKRQTDMVQLNCVTLIEICHGVLPGMIAAKSGGILNVASTAAFQPGPWMAIYYASKAFVLSFSEALHEEVREYGVRVAALCPGPTKTEFADAADMSDSELFKRFATDPAAVVRDGLAALDSNQAVKVSGVMNAVMAESLRFTPRLLARRLAGSMQKVRQS